MVTPFQKMILLTNTNMSYKRATPTGFSGFPGSDGKKFTCKVGDLGLIPGLGRSPRGGHDNPLQYYCRENPHGQRSLVGYSPRGRKELDTIERLSTHYLVFRVFLMCVVS